MADAKAQERTPRSSLLVASVVLFYMVVSVSTTFMNKGAFPKDKFPYPFTITCFQMIVALFWLGVLTLVQRFGPKPVLKLLNSIDVSDDEKNFLSWTNTKEYMSAIGAAGAFVGMLASGNLCLMFVQVSFYQAAKSQHILCILLLNYLWLKKTYPPSILLACLGVTAGFIINAFAEADLVRTVLDSDMASLGVGCLAGFISSFFVALYPILLNQSQLAGQNRWQMSININAMSLLWYIPLIAFEASSPAFLSSPAWADVPFWTFNFLTASVGFLLNLAAMLQVQYTSPLTHMISGSFKGAVTSLLGVLLSNNQMSLQSALGLGVLLFSSFLYSFFQRRESAKAAAAKPQKAE